MSLDKFFKIRVNSIRPNTPITFNLHVHINDKYTLYLRAGDKMTAKKIEVLDKKEKGHDVFFVPETERQKYKDYVHEEMNNEAISVADRAHLLRESSMTLVEELFESPDVGKALDDSKGVIDEFVGFMDREPEAMSHLITLSGHDFYTYQHSLDVSIYCLGIGQKAGYGKEELTELGRGALFHDIGKRNVSVDIICKNGPLDEVEWAQMQKHPLFGLKILNDEENVSDAIKACCFEHHENFLGNGYPQQLDGEDIHPMARIVAIADTFDAMTTKRSYNTPMSPKDALTFMKEKLTKRFDPELLDAMYSTLFNMA